MSDLDKWIDSFYEDTFEFEVENKIGQKRHFIFNKNLPLAVSLSIEGNNSEMDRIPVMVSMLSKEPKISVKQAKRMPLKFMQTFIREGKFEEMYGGLVKKKKSGG